MNQESSDGSYPALGGKPDVGILVQVILGGSSLEEAKQECGFRGDVTSTWSYQVLWSKWHHRVCPALRQGGGCSCMPPSVCHWLRAKQGCHSQACGKVAPVVKGVSHQQQPQQLKEGHP